MKICFVASDVNQKSGLGRVVHSLTRELAVRRHVVGVVSTDSIPGFDSCVVSLKFNYRNPLHSFSELIKMRLFFKKYDVIVSFDPRPVGILVYIASLGLNKKIVVHALGTYALFEEKNKIKNYLVERVYEKASNVFVINSFVKRCIEESKHGFTFGKNLAFVPVGVDSKLFLNQLNPSYKYARRYILSVGAIKERKGQYKSVQAFIKIADMFPDLHYVLVGDIYENIEYIHTIRSVIEKAKLQSRIHFIQKICDEELMDLYSGAQFFVLTPTTTRESIEGFGLVYLEAALCGVTSIGTWNTGAEAAIEHMKSGLLSSEDIVDLSETMKRLLLNDLERNTYAQYAKERALRYDWTKIADMYEEHLV